MCVTCQPGSSNNGAAAMMHVSPTLQALDLRMFLLGGVNQGGSMVDVGSLSGMIDQVKLLLTCLASRVLLLVQHHMYLWKAVHKLCTSGYPWHLSAGLSAACNAVSACSSWFALYILCSHITRNTRSDWFASTCSIVQRKVIQSMNQGRCVSASASLVCCYMYYSTLMYTLLIRVGESLQLLICTLVASGACLYWPHHHAMWELCHVLESCWLLAAGICHSLLPV